MWLHTAQTCPDLRDQTPSHTLNPAAQPPTERRSPGASLGSGPLLLAPWGPGDTGSDSAAPTGAGHQGRHPGSRGRSREIGAGAGQPCSAAPAGTEAQRAGCPGPAGLSSLSDGAAASHRPSPPYPRPPPSQPPPAPGRLPQSRGAPAAGCPRPRRCPALPCPARREASGRSFPHSPAGPAAHPPPAADGWLRGRGAGAGAAPFPAAAPRPPLLSLQKFLHLTEPPPRTDARPRRRAEGRRAASPPGRLCPREHEALRAERRGRGCECVRLSDCV